MSNGARVVHVEQDTTPMYIFEIPVTIISWVEIVTNIFQETKIYIRNETSYCETLSLRQGNTLWVLVSPNLSCLMKFTGHFSCNDVQCAAHESYTRVLRMLATSVSSYVPVS